MAPVVFLFAFLGITQAAPTYNASCNGNKCGHIISMPLVNDMKATLKADLDVSKMNEYLRDFIHKEIQTGIQTALKNEIGKMFKDAEDRNNNKLERRLTDIESKNNKKLARKLTDFELKFERKDVGKYAFFAYLSSSKSNLPDGTIIKFDKVSLNIGNSYNNSTGKFTSKQDGIYTFSWTVLSYDKQDFSSELVLDGNLVATNIVDNDLVGDYLTGSTTVVVQMRTGQSVWVRVAPGGEGDYLTAIFNSKSKITVFSGFMI